MKKLLATAVVLTLLISVLVFPAHASTPKLQVAPSLYQATSYEEIFGIDIDVSDILEEMRVIGIQFRLQFNSTLLEVMDVTEGTFMQQAGDTFFTYVVEIDDLVYGDNTIVGVILLPQIETPEGGIYTDFPSGSGTVATVTFKAIYQEIGLEKPPVGCNLTLVETKIIDEDLVELVHDVEDGYYEVLPWPRPTLRVEPDFHQACKLDQTFDINVTANDLHGTLMKTIAIEFRLEFNGTLLEVDSVTEGPLLQEAGDTFFVYTVNYGDPIYGDSAIVGVIILPNATGYWLDYADGSGTVATVTFKPVYQHVGLEKPPLACDLTLADTTILDEDLQEIGHYTEDGYYEIVPNNIGDINWDYKVDIWDVGIAALAFGSFPGHPRWTEIADINGDEKIDIKDIATIARNFGWVMVC